MDSNACSPNPTAELAEDLATLTAAMDRLATRDLSGLSGRVRVQRTTDPRGAEREAERRHRRPGGCGWP
jgi:hypothetical protein